MISSCFVVLSSTLLILVATQATDCDSGWFGTKCQYKCRCRFFGCHVNGTCIDGSSCYSQWFGPACQYADLAPKGYVKMNKFYTNQLTDGDENTCQDVSSSKSLTITWDIPYSFTWLRIHISNPNKQYLQELDVQFRNKSDTENILNCNNKKSSFVSHTAIDIHCDVNVTVDQIVVSWKNVQSICSIYISGGRNVALKQDTNQSSTYSVYSSDAAVNDEKSWTTRYPYCTHTRKEESPYWNLHFSRPKFLNRYVLYNRDDCCQYRLKGFVLQSFDSSQNQLFKHEDTKDTEDVYNLISVNLKDPVSRVTIMIPREERLTLCEVEMYGDSQCPKGFYGPECNKTCNCAVKNEDCFVSTGGCPSGCAAGFFGEGCVNECPTIYHGIDCMELCSTNCANQSCDRVSGKCNGCVPGRQGDSCLMDCNKGTYGLNCIESCSEFCAGDGSCDSYNGSCAQGCKIGYAAPKCVDICPGGTYGQDCSLNCTFCQENVTSSLPRCHHRTGACSHGCFPGQEELCASVSQEDDDGLSIVGVICGVVAALIIIVIIVVGYILWRRHKMPQDNGWDKDKIVEMDEITRQKDQQIQNSPQLKHTLPHVFEKMSIDSADTLSVDDQSKELNPDDCQEPTAQSKEGGVYCDMAQGVQKTTLSVENLEMFMLTHDRNFFKQQYSTIPTNKNVAMTASQQAENKCKNRYKDICAFDHSRVHLKADPKKNHGDYINASFVRGYNDDEKFIASQGPNKTMINDFVRMLWEQKVEKVVMLTNLVEDGKVKCERYWPEDGMTQFDEIQVYLTTTDVYADYTIRRLQLLKDGEEAQELTHYHFTSWPDKGVPTTPWGLVDFEQRVAFYPTDRPVVVHCSAGVGRTGTFIALRNVMAEAEQTGQMDFYSTLVKLRQDRVKMIQTLDQYIFLHKAAQVSQLCIGTTLTEDAIDERIKTLEMKSPKGGSRMELEFQTICKVCNDMEEIHTEAEKEENEDSNVYQNSESISNKFKNRFQDIIPKNIYRTVLSGNEKNMDDYINAVLVPSFTKQNQNILTQLPMPAAVNDFWRLITQYNVSLIVAFEVDSMDTDSTIATYMPRSEEEPFSCQSFDIEVMSLQQRKQSAFWKAQKLTVVNKKKSNKHEITHFKCLNADLDPVKLLKLTMQVRSNRSADQGRTLYMCRNGAAYSGLVCILSLLLDRMENDRRLTVPLIVGAIKAIRPQVIPTLDQYRMLYQVLHRYIETTNSYTNFGVPSREHSMASRSNSPALEETDGDSVNVYSNHPGVYK